MIISDEKALERLNSPLNLMNRLKNLSSVDRMKSAGIRVFIPSTETVTVVPEISEADKTESPSIDQLINDADSRIQIATAHDKAVGLMNSAIDQLTLRLPEIKADKLPSVITAASKMVTDIRREKIEADKARTAQNVHHHFYIPEQRKIETYDVIDVG